MFQRTPKLKTCWWRERDSYSLPVLTTRNLLILQSAKTGRTARYAEVRYTAGTRKAQQKPQTPHNRNLPYRDPRDKEGPKCQ